MHTPVKSRRHQPQQGSGVAKATAPTLIVLTSFFPESRRAMWFATELANHMAAQLILLHLDPLAAQDPNIPLQATPAEARELRQDLQQLANALHRPATIELGMGLLSRVLTDTARRYAPALFVLGRPADEEADFELSKAIVDELRAATCPCCWCPKYTPGPTCPSTWPSPPMTSPSPCTPGRGPPSSCCGGCCPAK